MARTHSIKVTSLMMALVTSMTVAACDSDDAGGCEETGGSDNDAALRANIELAKRVSQEVVFQGMNADELLAPDFVYHPGTSNEDMSREETLGFWAAFPATFPDGKLTFYNETAQGDLVMFQYILEGTYSFDLFGVGESAVGTPIVTKGYVTRRIESGQVAEEWDMPNLAGLLGQLQG